MALFFLLRPTSLHHGFKETQRRVIGSCLSLTMTSGLRRCNARYGVMDLFLTTSRYIAVKQTWRRGCKPPESRKAEAEDASIGSEGSTLQSAYLGAPLGVYDAISPRRVGRIHIDGIALIQIVSPAVLFQFNSSVFG